MSTYDPPNGTVYLLHFDRPYKHARHYLGWAKDLDARLEHHRAGTGARLLAVLKEHGIGFVLAGASRCCPVCGVKPRRVA